MSCGGKQKMLIADNFAAFFRAHVAHVNVRGKEFMSDHALFKEVYETLYDYHDKFVEQLLVYGESYPYFSVLEIADDTGIEGKVPNTKDRSVLIPIIQKDLVTLNSAARILYAEASKEVIPDLETLLGDYISAIGLLIWKIKANQ